MYNGGFTMQEKNINHNIYKKENQKYYSTRQNRDTKAGFERILTALDNLSVDDITDLKNEALKLSTHPLWREDYTTLSKDLVNAESALDKQPAISELPNDDQTEIEALKEYFLEASESLNFWYGFKIALFLTRYKTVRLSSAVSAYESDRLLSDLNITVEDDEINQEIENFDPLDLSELFGGKK